MKRNIVDEKTVLDKIEKAKTITSMPKAVKSGQPGLLELIQKVSANMDQYLGDRKNKYELITDQYRLAEYFDHIIENGIYSVDTETTGLDPMVDKVVGYSIYTPGEKAAYIPVNHISYITKQPLENQIPIDIVKREFDRATAADVKVVMANAKFDIRMLRQSFGVYLHVYFDCILAARLLNENEPSNKLKDLYKKYILKGQEDAFTFAELFSGVTFDLVPPNIGYLYAARDAEVTFELYEFQLPYLTPDHPLCIKQELVDVSYVFWNIEMPTIEVLADIEDTGVALDLNVAEQLTNKYIPIIQSYEEAFNRKVKEFGIEKHFDVSSPQQLAELFYDILGLVSPDKDKPRGTGKDILKELHHPIVDAVKDYRSVSTLVNTFVKKLPTTRNPRTGKVHCNYNQTGADTGRLACNDPNMQQIPNRGQSKEIRKMFMASTEYDYVYSNESENSITLNIFNEIKTNDGWKECRYIKVGDKIYIENVENNLEVLVDVKSVSSKSEKEICVNW